MITCRCDSGETLERTGFEAIIPGAIGGGRSRCRPDQCRAQCVELGLGGGRPRKGNKYVEGIMGTEYKEMEDTAS